MEQKASCCVSFHCVPLLPFLWARVFGRSRAPNPWTLPTLSPTLSASLTA